MISRKSTKLIGLAYQYHFQGKDKTAVVLSNVTKMYDFLYDRNYDLWFLQLVQEWFTQQIALSLKIQGIHTGESIVSRTKDFSWKAREDAGQKLLKELATHIIQLYETLPNKQSFQKLGINNNQTDFAKRLAEMSRPSEQLIESLKKQLQIDGYIFRDGKLYFSESSVIKEQEEQNILELLVNKLALNNQPIIINHLKLSEEHFLNSKWGDSISNARNFLEAILENVARSIHTRKNLTTPFPTQPVRIREFLESEGLIDQKEKEAISKVYGLISNTGSHPNLAQQDEARLMRHLALTFSQYVLLTFESYLKNNP